LPTRRAGLDCDPPSRRLSGAAPGALIGRDAPPAADSGCLMKNISWLNLIGGLSALVLAVVFVGGMAWLVNETALYVVVGIGLALMVWDLVVTNREIAEKRDAG
jgi:hypothetical protein